MTTNAPDSGRLALPIASDHPAFAGHFPGRPIVPGALLLDLAIAALEATLGQRVTRITQAKFTSPAVPGDAIELLWQRTAQGLRIELTSAGRALASARLELAPEPSL